jgi:hypothetical protein
VLVNVDEGNNEGVCDDVLDMEKIVTRAVRKRFYKSKVAFKAVSQESACRNLSKLGVAFKVVKNEAGTKAVIRERV